MLQKAAVCGYNSSNGGYSIGGYNGGGSYNVGGYTMVEHSPFYKQLCWEFGVSHNYVCTISNLYNDLLKNTL